jgi:hypothetical protein
MPATPPLHGVNAESPRVRDDLSHLATGLIDFASACNELLESEFALARRSLRAVLAAVIAAPILLVGLWSSALLLCVAALHTLGLGWATALASVVIAQLIGMVALLRAVRRWIGDLAMPRSRPLIAQLLDPPQ